MADYPLTVHVPEGLFDQLRQRARVTDRTVEQMLLDQLTNALQSPLPQDETAELNALPHLSDSALWTLAAEQMPRAEQERLSVLLALNERVTLNATESAELDELLERGDRLMLRKAEATAILTKRGYTVSSVQLRTND